MSHLNKAKSRRVGQFSLTGTAITTNSSADRRMQQAVVEAVVAQMEEVHCDKEKKGAGEKLPESSPADDAGVVHWNHHVGLVERRRIHDCAE